MCSLIWALGSPDIWSNITLSVSERKFLDEINILFGRIKQTALHGVGGPHPIS